MIICPLWRVRLLLASFLFLFSVLFGSLMLMHFGVRVCSALSNAVFS